MGVGLLNPVYTNVPARSASAPRNTFREYVHTPISLVLAVNCPSVAATFSPMFWLDLFTRALREGRQAQALASVWAEALICTSLVLRLDGFSWTGYQSNGWDSGNQVWVIVSNWFQILDFSSE